MASRIEVTPGVERRPGRLLVALPPGIDQRFIARPGSRLHGPQFEPLGAYEDVDGALVGGASLKPDEMAGIVARAGVTAAARGQMG